MFEQKMSQALDELRKLSEDELVELRRHALQESNYFYDHNQDKLAAGMLGLSRVANILIEEKRATPTILWSEDRKWGIEV